MIVSDPGCEVWICPCGVPVAEPGRCFECEMADAEAWSLPGKPLTALSTLALVLMTALCLVAGFIFLDTLRAYWSAIQ